MFSFSSYFALLLTDSVDSDRTLRSVASERRRSAIFSVVFNRGVQLNLYM